MKEGIHPEYYQATVTCNCGNTFVTGSTKKDIHVEVCSKCHSFYTGQQKAARADGRIEKFNKKYGVGNNQVMYNKVEGYILNLIIFITGVSCMGKKKKTTHYSGIGGQAVL